MRMRREKEEYEDEDSGAQAPPEPLEDWARYRVQEKVAYFLHIFA